MTGQPTKVLFILAYPRSGSTILGSILNELEGFTFLGELRHLWRHLAEGRRRCGCGEPLARCQQWKRILRTTRELLLRTGDAWDGPDGSLEPAAVAACQRRALRGGAWARLALGRPAGAPLERHLKLRGHLYRAAAEATGASVLVDSSKRPVDALVTLAVPGVEVWLLHLIRDPRGAAYSRQRNRELRLRENRHPSPRLARRRQLLLAYDGLRWLGVSQAAEITLRRLPGGRGRALRYEDLVSDPQRQVRELASWLGLPQEPSAFVDQATVRLGGNHSVGGNRVRHLTGQVAIQPDLAWQSALSPAEKVMLSCMTAPALRRYGYPFRSHGRVSHAGERSR